MSQYYLTNFLGVKLNEVQLRNIPHPKIELHTHVTMKTVQAFSILGAMVVAPISSIAQGKTDLDSIQQKMYEFGKTGMLIGLVAGPLMTLARIYGSKLKYPKIWDRAYRIRVNRGQMRVDRLTMVGVTAGMGAAYYLGAELCKGAVFGLCGGCILGGVMNMM